MNTLQKIYNYYKRYTKNLTFVFSCDSHFLSDKIKANTKDILFIEYGKITLENRTSTTVELAITVGTPWTNTIQNEKNELEEMQRLTNMLETLISNTECQNCGCGFEIINEKIIQPVQPEALFGYLGAVAFVKIRCEE